MFSAMRVLFLLLALARCRSFLVMPAPLAPGATPATAVARPERACSRRAQHRGPPSRLHSSPRNSPDDLDKARQRLIASSGYEQMVNRVDGNSPFADLEGSSSRGVKEEEEEAAQQSSSFLRQVARAVIDVAIALVPVALVVTFAKFPPPVVEALGSAVTAIRASPIEPVLEALPWEPVGVLKSVALGGVAILLSPVADRLVVSPSIQLWAQARIKSMSSS
eukprot:g13653.t2